MISRSSRTTSKNWTKQNGTRIARPTMNPKTTESGCWMSMDARYITGGMNQATQMPKNTLSCFIHIKA
jgi:hypothetical protein